MTAAAERWLKRKQSDITSNSTNSSWNILIEYFHEFLWRRRKSDKINWSCNSKSSDLYSWCWYRAMSTARISNVSFKLTVSEGIIQLSSTSDELIDKDFTIPLCIPICSAVAVYILWWNKTFFWNYLCKLHITICTIWYDFTSHVI